MLLSAEHLETKTFVAFANVEVFPNTTCVPAYKYLASIYTIFED